MLYQLEKLNDSEKEAVLNAPAYVTLLIAGADDNIDEAEMKRALQVVHTKTYSESQDIREIYKELDHDFENRLHNLIDRLPKTHAEREASLISGLEQLNSILKKIDVAVAHKYYRSLKSFASHIANASGGLLGVHNVSLSEKKYIGLPMIQDPQA